MIQPSHFQVNGKQIKFNLVWKDAIHLNTQFDYDITKLFFDQDVTQQMMMRLILDNELLLNMCLYIVNKVEPHMTKDDLMEYLPSPAHLEEFREAMWGAVVNFSSPQLRGILVDSWQALKKDLSQLTVDKMLSTTSSSPSEADASTPQT